MEYPGEKNIELKSNTTVKSATAVAAMYLQVILKFNDKEIPAVSLFFISHMSEYKDILFKLLNAFLCSSSDHELPFLHAIYKIIYTFSNEIALVLTLQKFYYYQWGKVLIYKKMKAGKLLNNIWAWELLLKRNFIHKNVWTGLSKEYNV